MHLGKDVIRDGLLIPGDIMPHQCIDIAAIGNGSPPWSSRLRCSELQRFSAFPVTPPTAFPQVSRSFCP